MASTERSSIKLADPYWHLCQATKQVYYRNWSANHAQVSKHLHRDTPQGHIPTDSVVPHSCENFVVDAALQKLGVTRDRCWRRHIRGCKAQRHPPKPKPMHIAKMWIMVCTAGANVTQIKKVPNAM
jgi:hypothetical protein